MIKDIINSFGGVAPSIETAKHGDLVFANITEHAQEDVFLSQYARRKITESNMAQARRMLAPDAAIVDDGDTFSWRYWELDQSYTTVDYAQLKRAVGGDYKAISDESTKRSGTIEDIGLCIVAENRHLSRIPGYEQYLVQKLTDTIERATFIETVSLFEAFAEEIEVDLSTDNVDDVIRDLMVDAIVPPNSALMGAKFWNARLSYYADKLTTGSLSAPKTQAAFGEMFGLDVLVPTGRKATTTGGVFPLIVADKLYLSVAQGVSTEDMSNMKVFRPPEAFTVYKWAHPQGKKTMFTVSVGQGLQITSTPGAYVLKLKS